MNDRVIGRASERRRKQRRTRRVPCKGALATMASCIPSLKPEAQPPLDEPLASALNKRPPPVHIDAADVERFSRAYEIATTSTSTRRIYLNRLTLFLAWCAARGVGAMPAHPDVLRRYVVSLAAEQKALSTIDVSMAAITMVHRALGHAPPMSNELQITLRLLRRTLGPRATRSPPISLALLRQIVASCDHDPHGIRDRALILVTYFGRLRRAEITGLNREGAHREERGYRLTIEREPRDRTGMPTPLVSHEDQSLCPVLALDEWLHLPAMWVRGLNIAPARGPLFVGLHQGRRQRLRVGDRLAPADVDRIVKRRAIAAGLNPAGLSAVSLCAGFDADIARGDRSSIA
jgi:integrase